MREEMGIVLFAALDVQIRYPSVVHNESLRTPSSRCFCLSSQRIRMDTLPLTG
jgi:hypothetical protein